MLGDGRNPERVGDHPDRRPAIRNEVDTCPAAGRPRRPGLLPAEVIVIDDASEDGTLDAVETAGPFPFPMRILANPGTGKKAGLSFGIREARTEWVVGIDADARIGTEALAAMAEGLATQCDSWDMALLPLRIARQSEGAPADLLSRLQALDFAAMQGWAVAAVLRGRPAMASGGGWIWRRDAFPHDQLRPERPSGDDVFSLAALIERGDGHRVGWLADRRAMVSAGPMDTLGTLLDQRIGGAPIHALPQGLARGATGGLDRHRRPCRGTGSDPDSPLGRGDILGHQECRRHGLYRPNRCGI